MSDRIPERQGVAMIGSALMADACGTLLAAETGVAILAHGSLDDALSIARRIAPTFMIVELRRGDPAHATIFREIRKLPSPPRIIVVANRASREQILAALHAEVESCIAVEGGRTELVRALETVRKNERYIGQVISEMLEAVAASNVTARERQVLALVAEGKTETEIAAVLELSRKTVHAHRTSVMRKLGAHNSAMLIRLAIERGLLPTIALVLAVC